MKEKISTLCIFAAAIVIMMIIGKPSEAFEAEKTVFPETIRIYLTESGETAEISGAEYIKGCLCAQIPIDYEAEALKAQAAASATYALRMIERLKGTSGLPEGADISDDPKLCQPYFTDAQINEQYGSDYERFRDKINEAAVYGTKHIITYSGEPIYAVYHSVSAGRTCSALPVWGRELPYLEAADSPWDTSFINFECVNEMTSEQARLALISFDSEIEAPADCARWFTEMNVNEDGYVISVKIGRRTFTGGDIWRIFGLRSTAFTVSYSDNIFTFTTKGYGHGAGLSQFGANEIAKQGYTVSDILHHYYGKDISF